MKEKEKNLAAAAGENNEMKLHMTDLELREAREKMRPGNMRVWDKFDAKAAELRRELAKELQIESRADPDAVDAAGVELMRSGILNANDYFGLAEKYDGNSTMLRLVGNYARELAGETEDPRDRAALTVLAKECAAGIGKTLKTWDEIITTANYCSGRGGSGTKQPAPQIVVQMGNWWEALSSSVIGNF